MLFAEARLGRNHLTGASILNSGNTVHGLIFVSLGRSHVHRWSTARLGGTLAFYVEDLLLLDYVSRKVLPNKNETTQLPV